MVIMKKLLVLFSMILCMSSLSFASEVHMRHRQLGSTHGGSTKSPVLPWIIDLDDYVLTMSATPCDYTLNLYDEDEEVVYSVFVPAGSTMIVLPSTLSGSFEIRFETDTYYYYGYIDL